MAEKMKTVGTYSQPEIPLPTTGGERGAHLIQMMEL